MGLISNILGLGRTAGGIGNAVERVSEVFTLNKTKQAEFQHDQITGAMKQFGHEFKTPSGGVFDRLINGLNRLPRPTLALGTIGLFVYAMIEPTGFTHRMQGLAYVPEPLWWLLGAIVSFYFGARELHYSRRPVPLARQLAPKKPNPFVRRHTGRRKNQHSLARADANAALEDWLNQRR